MSVDFEKMRRDAHAIADVLPDDLLHRWVAVGSALRRQAEAKNPEEQKMWASVARIIWEDHEVFKRLAEVDIGPEHYPDPEVVAAARARVAAEDQARIETIKARQAERERGIQPDS